MICGGIQIVRTQRGTAHLQLEEVEQLRVQIAVPLRDDVNEHHADAVLQIACTLDRECSTVSGTILVCRADELDGGDHLRTFVVVQNVDFKQVKAREIQRDRGNPDACFSIEM